MSNEKEARRQLQQARQAMGRAQVKVVHQLQAVGLECVIAGLKLADLGAALQAAERREVVDEIMDHPDLAALEDDMFRWYGGDGAI